MHKIQFLLHRKHSPFNQSMLFTETNASCKDRSKHKNTLCGQNADLNITGGGTYWLTNREIYHV